MTMNDVDTIPQNPPRLTTGGRLPNDKQTIWLRAYLRTLNATEAARVAGYSDTLSSGKEVKAVMRPFVDYELAQMALSSDEITNRIAQIALFDSTLYIDEATGYADFAKLKSSGMGWMIAELETKQVRDSSGNTATIYKVKFHNQFKALELLGRYHKLDGGINVNLNVVNKGFSNVSPDDWDAPKLESGE
tara:strand:+ start:162 stop:731 length:570 start_codon:yes stop_codon:yes gene_type:complete